MYKDICMQYCTKFCKVWNCLIFKDSKLPWNILRTYYYLFILEPLNVVECLGPANYVFTLNEKEKIQAMCIYFGVPAPKLTCTLLDANKQILGTTIPKIVTVNFTSLFPMTLLNVGKTATCVKCFIYHHKHSTHTETRKVVVHGM